MPVRLPIARRRIDFILAMLVAVASHGCAPLCLPDINVELSLLGLFLDATGNSFNFNN